MAIHQKKRPSLAGEPLLLVSAFGGSADESQDRLGRLIRLGEHRRASLL
jgi:hypothetical protein